MPFDSKRLAAFRVGYHGRLLKAILEYGIALDIPKMQDVGGCLKTIENALFVLTGNLSPTEYTALESILGRLEDLHDLACGVGRPEQTAEVRGVLDRQEKAELERLDFLCERALWKEPLLASISTAGFSVPESAPARSETPYFKAFS